MEQERKTLFFVVATFAVPEQRAMYEVDIQQGTILLNERMARGRTVGTSLVADLLLEKVSLVGERISFVAKESTIESTLVAVLDSFVKAEECYQAEGLRPVDVRWFWETSDVLSRCKRSGGERCLFSPEIIA